MPVTIELKIWLIYKDIEMSRVIILEIFFLPRLSLILCMTIVKASAVNLVEINLYCLPLRSCFLLRCSTSFLLIIASKRLLMTLKWLILWLGRAISCFLFVQRAHSRYILWPWETYLLKVEAKQLFQDWRYFRTRVLKNYKDFFWIGSFHRIKAFDNSAKNSRADIGISQSLYSLRWGKFRKEHSLLSNLKLAVKYSKELSLIRQRRDKPGCIYKEVTDGLPLLSITFTIF